ncbi:MAG: beta-hydroxyacyl-ACP dehydratase [Rikenellaceae bacterium]|nr:beta-hydroxyacyl-ACP dehydratase [Rikenellaceae bacterium]
MLTGLYDIKFITSLGENSYIAQVCINPYDPIFPGHFPGQPVLPGVCTLAIVKECICLASEKRLRYSEMAQCKFTGMVDPSKTDILKLEFRLINIDGKTTVNVTVGEGERVILKMKAVMVEVY